MIRPASPFTSRQTGKLPSGAKGRLLLTVATPLLFIALLLLFDAVPAGGSGHTATRLPPVDSGEQRGEFQHQVVALADPLASGTHGWLPDADDPAASHGDDLPPLDLDNRFPEPSFSQADENWEWRLLPNRLIYRPYLAGVNQPRMAAVFNMDENNEWKWDLSIGGRVGLVRYGSGNEILPQGWQLDVEGAAFPRLTPPGLLLEATDYRFGIPLSYGYGGYQMQIAYCHISSHLGDEWARKHGILNNRKNYSRDAIVWGHGYLPTDSLRFYGQVSFGFYTDVCEPWHLQFGIEYSQLAPTGFEGVPFFATNCELRQENNYGGYVAIQTGWQWTGDQSGRRLRLGIQYYNGQHEKLQFYDMSEQKFGFGIWYDF
jgi:hypothetical protein